MERTVGTLTMPYDNAVANLNWIKIIGVGSCNVGKTSLIKHFCESKFTSNYQPTVGVDYGFKVENINGCDVRVNIWDFSGNTDYLEVRNELYSKTNGIFLVFDVTNATTFESLDQWLREITQYSSNSAQIFIVGNKVDLKHTRSVNQNNLKKLLQNYKCQYFETSAATGEGVNDMFKAMLTTILSEKT